MKLPNWSFTVILYAAMVVPPGLMYLWPSFFIPVWGSGVLASILLGVGSVLWTWRLDPRKDPETGSGCFSLVMMSFLFSWFGVYAMVSGWVESARLRKGKGESNHEGS